MSRIKNHKCSTTRQIYTEIKFESSTSVGETVKRVFFKVITKWLTSLLSQNKLKLYSDVSLFDDWKFKHYKV